MDILGLGVLLTGESGLGKSELGLELISRGHGLVADDAVDLYRINQTAIEGRCPELLQNLLEVRGIGLLDIKAIFGETAVRRKMRLQAHRAPGAQGDDGARVRAPALRAAVRGRAGRAGAQGGDPVDAGRNLAVLVEAAVRNTILQLRGIDTYQEFVERHQRAMAQGRAEQRRLRGRRSSTCRRCGQSALVQRGVQRQRVVLQLEAARLWRRRAGASRSRRRRTPRPGRSPGTPGGRGAGLR